MHLLCSGVDGHFGDGHSASSSILSWTEQGEQTQQ